MRRQIYLFQNCDLIIIFYVPNSFSLARYLLYNLRMYLCSFK